MAKTKDRVADAKPYVQRALQDEELREDLKSAFSAARGVYDELLGGRGATRVATRVATDKEIQDNLRSAIEDLRRAANRLQGAASRLADRRAEHRSFALGARRRDDRALQRARVQAVGR